MKFRFAENKTVTDITKVPDPFKVLYQENEDGSGYTLNENLAKIAESVDGLNNSLEKSRSDASKAKTDLGVLSEFGESPEEVKQAFDAKLAEAQEAAKTGTTKLVEKARQEVIDQYEKQKKADTARNEALQNQLYDLMVTNQITEALQAEGGNSKLLSPMLKQMVKVNEQDGKFNVSVVDQDGDPRHSFSTGQPMTIKELVGEMKADPNYAPAFESQAPSGSGAAKPGQRKPAPTPQKDDDGANPVKSISAGLQQQKRSYGVGTPEGMQ